MSDGNFNRNILPYQNYQSGLRAGKAIAKAKAIDTLNALLLTTDLSLSEAEQEALRLRFKADLEVALGL